SPRARIAAGRRVRGRPTRRCIPATWQRESRARCRAPVARRYRAPPIGFLPTVPSRTSARSRGRRWSVPAARSYRRLAGVGRRPRRRLGGLGAWWREFTIFAAARKRLERAIDEGG